MKSSNEFGGRRISDFVRQLIWFLFHSRRSLFGFEMQGPRFEPGTSWWEAQMLPLRYAIPLGKQTHNNIVLANCLRPFAFQHESNIKQKFKLRYSWKKYLIRKVFSFCLVPSDWDLRSFLFFRNRGKLEGELFLHSKKMSEFSHYDRKEEVEGVGQLGWGRFITNWMVSAINSQRLKHSHIKGLSATRCENYTAWITI